ncbi:hypothetical protein EJ07DRAFT_155477 [Lizonia empirigonia]|nr:hypothetical protein EJ07DRAFT_155477 [Lizonia empirigonia]
MPWPSDPPTHPRRANLRSAGEESLFGVWHGGSGSAHPRSAWPGCVVKVAAVVPSRRSGSTPSGSSHAAAPAVDADTAREAVRRRLLRAGPLLAWERAVGVVCDLPLHRPLGREIDRQQAREHLLQTGPWWCRGRRSPSRSQYEAGKPASARTQGVMELQNAGPHKGTDMRREMIPHAANIPAASPLISPTRRRAGILASARQTCLMSFRLAASLTTHGHRSSRQLCCWPLFTLGQFEKPAAVISRHRAHTLASCCRGPHGCVTAAATSLSSGRSAVDSRERKQSHVSHRGGAAEWMLCSIEHPHRTFAQRQAPSTSYLGRVVCSTFRAEASAGEQTATAGQTMPFTATASASRRREDGWRRNPMAWPRSSVEDLEKEAGRSVQAHAA